MNKLADARQTLDSLVQLLRTTGNLDLTAQVYHTDSGSVAPGQPRRPELIVEFTGPDAPLVTACNGDLLNALEHILARVLRLDYDEYDRISFDANNFKADRDAELLRLAREAVREVGETRAPHIFAPMVSRERRILHLALAPSGLKSVSTGDRFKRSVVLYPPGTRVPTFRSRDRSRLTSERPHSN